MKLDIKIYKKDRTVCKDCYNKKKRKSILIQNEITTSHQHRKIENNNNNRTILVAPSFRVNYILCQKFHEYQIEIFI